MRAKNRPDGETAPASAGLSSQDRKKRASSAIRFSIGVFRFGELRRLARAGRLPKKRSSLLQGRSHLQNRQQGRAVIKHK